MHDHGQIELNRQIQLRPEDGELFRQILVSEQIEAKFTGLDRKSRTISLSIKAKEAHEEAQAVQSYKKEVTAGTSLGDLLKEQIAGGGDS